VLNALSRAVLLASLAWAGVVAVAVNAGAAEPRPGPEGSPPGLRPGPAPRRSDDVQRRDRRDIEGGGGGRVRSAEELTRAEPTLMLEWREGGCAIDGHRAFVKSLLGLENPSDAMSLEVWGDAHEYVPYQKVFYYLRVPRTAYVTLFWVGPKQDIFVPFQNLRIPPDRDVSVDPDSIVVPPLGREQWVAVATLEPMPDVCWTSESAHMAWIERMKKLPYGIGRWEVHSKETR